MAINLMRILLAEDDFDDCELFADALDEINCGADLKTVNDGEQLINFLTHCMERLPSVLFLDLNMPGKNGMECLIEIRQKEIYNSLEVIIFSTSFDSQIVEELRKNGARHYIRKPNEFSQLKKVIALAVDSINNKPGNSGNFELKP